MQFTKYSAETHNAWIRNVFHELFNCVHAQETVFLLLLTFISISYLKQVLIKSIDILLLYFYTSVTYKMENT